MMTRKIETTDPHRQFEQVAQKCVPQSKLLRAWELKGGISAQVTALEIEQTDGQTKKMIVRQHGEGHRMFITQAFERLSTQ